MDFAPVRKFLLASYYDLPNILFVGSLVLGSLTGYLPLVWMSLGLVFNWVSTTAVQLLFKIVIDNGWLKWLPAALLKGLEAPKAAMNRFGYTGTPLDLAGSSQKGILSIPSQWMSASTFFAIFSIYNAIKVRTKDAAEGAEKGKVAARHAFSFSTLLIGVAFFGLILLRAFTGYESLIGGLFGVLVGGSLGIAFWHLLDACGAGMVPDILQVMGSLAPERRGPQTPVMCVAPETVSAE
jgi:hypothetical protein